MKKQPLRKIKRLNTLQNLSPSPNVYELSATKPQSPLPSHNIQDLDQLDEKQLMNFKHELMLILQTLNNQLGSVKNYYQTKISELQNKIDRQDQKIKEYESEIDSYRTKYERMVNLSKINLKEKQIFSQSTQSKFRFMKENPKDTQNTFINKMPDNMQTMKKELYAQLKQEMHEMFKQLHRQMTVSPTNKVKKIQINQYYHDTIKNLDFPEQNHSLPCQKQNLLKKSSVLSHQLTSINSSKSIKFYNPLRK